jgi:hypothetical protein
MGVKVALDWVAEDGSATQPVIDSALFECADGPVHGRFTPPSGTAGALVLRLDNSFSWKNAKMVQWRAYNVAEEDQTRKAAAVAASSRQASSWWQWSSRGLLLGSTPSKAKQCFFFGGREMAEMLVLI